MRVVKEAEERKNEILDAVERLFAAKGFDGTSTSEILEAVGIARGTLYYHFKSKEEILDAMVSRMTLRFVEQAEVVAAQKNVPVLQRFVMMMFSLNVGGDSFGQELLRQIYKPQNALMHQKMEKTLLCGLSVT